jgi:hypothetical protein
VNGIRQINWRVQGNRRTYEYPTDVLRAAEAHLLACLALLCDSSQVNQVNFTSSLDGEHEMRPVQYACLDFCEEHGPCYLHAFCAYMKQ